MSKKKSSLAEALSKQQSNTATVKQTAETTNNGNSDSSLYPPSRRGKKHLTVFVDPAVTNQLKLIGLESDRSNQEMMIEAINDFFTKNGKPTIA